MMCGGDMRVIPEEVSTTPLLNADSPPFSDQTGRPGIRTLARYPSQLRMSPYDDGLYSREDVERWCAWKASMMLSKRCMCDCFDATRGAGLHQPRIGAVLVCLSCGKNVL